MWAQSVGWRTKVFWFLPVELREGGGADGRRARTAASGLVLVLLADLVVWGVRATQGRPAPIAGPLALAIVALLVHFRFTGKLAVLGHAFAALLTASLTGAAALSGGLGAPALYALVLVPLFALFILGSRAGVAWAVVAVAVVGLFKLVDVEALEWFPVPAPGRQLPALGAALVIVATLGVGWVYESARDATAKELAERESALRALLRSVPDAILELDATGRCVRAHPGHHPELLSVDAVGARVDDVLVAPLELTELVEQARQSGAEIEREYTVGVRRLRVRALDRGDGALVFARDITDLHTMETRLAEAELLASLERADRMSSIGLLAAGMAHEINNPLAYLAGNLEFVRRRLEGTDDELTAAVDDSLVASDRIGRIVRDLKHYVRDDAAEVETVALPDVVQSALTLAQNQLQHTAEVTASHDDPPPVLGVESRLVQVVLNLLVNASHATADSEAARIAVRTYRDDEGRAVLEVTDSGPGFPPEHPLEELVQPFFTTKPPGVGTGLGLAVCDGIVRQLGGELRLDSPPEGGARVRVILPPAERRASSRAPRPLTPTEPPGSGRILVIDDEPLVRRALRRLLHQHAIDEAASGREALEMVESSAPFDLILCDVMMPGLNGIELFRELVRRWPDLEPRVVFMTGGAFDRRVQELFGALVDRPLILDKPFDAQILQRVVRERLAGQSDVPGARSSTTR